MSKANTKPDCVTPTFRIQELPDDIVQEIVDYVAHLTTYKQLMTIPFFKHYIPTPGYFSVITNFCGPSVYSFEGHNCMDVFSLPDYLDEEGACVKDTKYCIISMGKEEKEFMDIWFLEEQCRMLNRFKVRYFIEFDNHNVVDMAPLYENQDITGPYLKGIYAKESKVVKGLSIGSEGLGSRISSGNVDFGTDTNIKTLSYEFKDDDDFIIPETLLSPLMSGNITDFSLIYASERQLASFDSDFVRTLKSLTLNKESNSEDISFFRDLKFPVLEKLEISHRQNGSNLLLDNCLFPMLEEFNISNDYGGCCINLTIDNCDFNTLKSFNLEFVSKFQAISSSFTQLTEIFLRSMNQSSQGLLFMKDNNFPNLHNIRFMSDKKHKMCFDNCYDYDSHDHKLEQPTKA